MSEVAKPSKPRKQYVEKGWEFTPEQLEKVSKLAGYGLTCEHIADFFGVSRSGFFLKKQPGSDLEKAIDKGVADAASYVTGKLFNQIKNGNITAIIFWLKTRMGWKESSRVEHTGRNGDSIKIEDQNKVDAREELRLMLAKAFINKPTAEE